MDKIIIITFKTALNSRSFLYNFLVIEKIKNRLVKTISNNCFGQCFKKNHIEALNQISMQTKKDFPDATLICNW